MKKSYDDRRKQSFVNNLYILFTFLIFNFSLIAIESEAAVPGALPTISCPPDISVNNDPGVCFAIVTLGLPVTNDTTGTDTVFNDAPATFPVGITNVTWTVRDTAGNSTTCQQIVTVTDNELPTITCPANVTVNADPGQCFSTIPLATPVTIDNCGIASVTNNQPSTFPVGITTVTWTVLDIHGNSATCQQTITVVDNELPSITCPADISVNNNAGQCFASVSLGSYTATDNCGISTVTNNAPATFPVGITTVTWTVTDIHGNINTCQQTVTVTDNEAPTITCPANIRAYTSPGQNSMIVSLGTPVTNDNCGVATITNNAPPAFPVGTTIVTWTVTDIHGNSATCQQTVLVIQLFLPTIICPANISVNNDPGVCFAIVNLGLPVTNDSTGTDTVFNNAPATFTVGSTNVTWTVRDTAGNSASCQQIVSVTDNEIPTITCPANVSVNNDPGQCFATVSPGSPVSSDNCGIASVTNNAPATFPVGSTIVTWTVHDIHGNTNTCLQTITVADNEPPTITCPANVTVNADPGQCFSTIPLATPVTIDNCGIASVTNNQPSTFPVGITTVTWTVQDIHGNSANCQQTVTVVDNELPAITCPANISVNNNAGQCFASVSLGSYTATDNCGVSTVTNNAPATFPVGLTTVTWTVTDIHGNINTCQQTVTVIDNENPTITCPANIIAYTSPGQNFAIVFPGTPVTNDNCGVATITNNAPPAFPVGTTIVTWTVTDIHGNSATCQQTVLVIQLFLPTILCPANISVNNDPGVCFAIGNLGLPVTNDSTGTDTVFNNAPATFPVGSTIIIWTVRDTAGNSASCQQIVTVTDNEIPTITCPANVSVNNDPGQCFATVSLGSPVTHDNCGIASVTNNAPATFPVGSTIVTWTVTDIHGNTNTCQQTITVADNEPPTITCPANVSINNDPGNCYATVSLLAPVTNDNCGVASVTNNAPSTIPVGTTTITWTVQDIHGNSATCQQTVTVVDNELPTITCPANISVNNNAGQCFASVSLGSYTATDNCGVSTVTNNAPATFPVGLTTVIWTVTDIHGNINTCQQTVTVTDNEAPTITCPANITVNNDPGQCYATVVLGSPIINDNCGIASVTNNTPPNFPVGITTVIWTVTDIHGNTNTCQQTVTVNDNQPPVIICPANITVNNNAGHCYSTVTLLQPVTTDNCGISSVTNNAPPNFPVGATTVIWTALDIHGNSSTCQQMVTVTDNEPPTIICPSNITVNNDPGHCYATVTLANPVTNDNCGVASVTNNAPQTFPVGTTTVLWTVHDIHGNLNTCQQIVTVVDNQVPTITCPADVSVTNNPGHCYATLTLESPVTTDNCGVATVTNNAPSNFPVGITTVTWTVTDIHGNSNTCQQTITVTDTDPPTITCPADVTTNNDPGECFATLTLVLPVTNDNCGIATVTNNAPATFPVGTTVVTWIVTDLHGNTNSCTQTVIVNDNEPPAITCPDNITTTNDPGKCYASVYLGSYQATDNCGISTVTNDAPPIYPVGLTTVTWTATDIHGNSSTCLQLITVTDNEIPVIQCQHTFTANNDPGDCFAALTLAPPVTSDNCGIASLVNNAPASFPIGSTMVTWTVTDLHGNSDTCQEEVIITDNELPVITCPADITVNNDTGKCTAAVTIGASQATDNCGIASLTNDAPALFPVGRTIVTWTATDIHGNTNTCQQTITVKDVTLPDIYCRPDVSVNNDPGKCYATIILAPPLADDNCGIASLTNNAPALFPVGSTVVTWTVIDLSGNTAICVQNVTVTDIENPNIQPPADISTHTDRGEFYATVNLGTPVTADNCGIASVTNNAPLKFQIGLTRVTWTVVDVHGHSDSAVQFVTVSPVLPTAIDDYDTTNMNFPITINYMANDINPAGNTLNTIICRNPAHGTMKIEGDSLIVYTPDAGYKGPDLIQYSLYDAFLKGASDTATIHILVGAEVPIFIPNAITPNGDGFNDTWIITGIDGFPSNNVTVFNRWGDEIISLDAYDNKSVVWAGNNKQGNRVADGTYFYVVNIDGVGKFKGWIFVRANSQ